MASMLDEAASDTAPAHRYEPVRVALAEITAARAGGVPQDRIEKICAALMPQLHALHQGGKVYGALSPQTVMLDERGNATLAPAPGPARPPTEAAATRLAAGYAAFEQYTDDPAWPCGPWTDVYALSALMHVLVAGAAPPPAVRRCINDNYVPLSERGLQGYTSQLLRAIDAGLARETAARPQDMEAYAAALGMQMGAPPLVDLRPEPPAGEPEPAVPVADQPSRRGWLSALAAACLLALGGWWWLHAGDGVESGQAVSGGESAGEAAERAPQALAEPAARSSTGPSAQVAAQDSKGPASQDGHRGATQASRSPSGAMDSGGTPVSRTPQPGAVPAGGATARVPDTAAAVAGPAQAGDRYQAAQAPGMQAGDATQGMSNAGVPAGEEAGSRPQGDAVAAAGRGSASPAAGGRQAPTAVGSASGRASPGAASEASGGAVAASDAPSGAPSGAAAGITAASAAPSTGVTTTAAGPAIATDNSAATPVPAPSAATRARAPDAAAARVRVQLDIRPWGEVSIDGVARGVSPPMKSLLLPPGRYRVVVRNSVLPPYAAALEVRAGQPAAIRHTFE